MGNISYTIQLDTISEGYDGKTQWCVPRVGIIPPTTAVLLMTRSSLAGFDLFLGTYGMRSDDMGKTWSVPSVHPSLGRSPYNGGRVEIIPGDLVPAWHAVSGKLLALGLTGCYRPGANIPVEDNSQPVFASYSVYDALARTWPRWEYLELPDREHFYWAAGGTAQRVDLPNGDILWSLYCMDRQSVGANFWKSCFFATVVRCGFDGRTLTYLEHGNEMTVPDVRGLCEPSLTRFGERYYLTMRNDRRGYVAVSRDGLHYDKPIPWTFDDGTELGSYNTQQHWVTHSDGLFLVYTRRGANNDHVIRHRAPLFMAQVDSDRLCVVRETERILLPDKGAQFGNFGTVNVSPYESWVVDAEGMQGDAEKPSDIERTVRRGGNNRVYLGRIRWEKPNRWVAGQEGFCLGQVVLQ